MMKKVYYFIVVMAVIALIIGMARFLKEKKLEIQNLEVAKEMTRSVKTTVAKTKNISQRRDFLAQIQASKSAYIASKFSATIKKIYVNENELVKKGDLLIALDDTEIQSNLNALNEKYRALKIDVNNAKNILQRNKKLLGIQAISKEAYENSNVIYQNKLASYKGIKDSIKQVNSQLKYLNIKAPFHGVVGSKLNNEGSLALAGKAILTLNSNDQKIIFTFVDGAKPILEGQKVFFKNELIGSVLKRYEDAKNSLLVAEVKLNKPLPFANKSYKMIAVEVDSLRGCSVPLEAILHRNDKTYTMNYVQGKFVENEVKIKLQNTSDVVLSQCTENKLAVGSEAKLALLPSFGKVIITKDN